MSRLLAFVRRGPRLFAGGASRPSLFLVRARLVNSFGHPFKYEKIQPGWRNADKIPDNYDLIYKGDIESYVKWTLGILMATSAAAGFLGLRKLIVGDDFGLPWTGGENDTIIMFEGTVKENLLVMAAGFTLAFCTYLLIIRTVLRIYKFQDKYIAVFADSKLPWKTQNLHFVRDQVEYREQGKYFTTAHSSFKFKGRNASLAEENFRTPRDLNVLMSKVSEDDDF